MRRTHLTALALTAATLPGCYFYYPSVSKQKTPRVDGERVVIETHDTDYERPCRSYDRKGDCHWSSEGFTVTDHLTTFKATYGGRALSQYELRQLVDPDFDKKIARIKSNKGLCNISLVPSIIAVAGLAALTIAGPFYDKLGDAALPVALGASGAALGGTLLSYPLGGFACKRAGREFKAMFKGVDPDDTGEILVNDDNSAYVSEIGRLAEDFNARFGTGTKEAAPDGESQPETEVPPPAADPAPAPAPKPAAADGKYAVGDKVMVDWKGTPYKATILKVESDGRYRIHYDGFASSWDEAVPASRIVGRQ